MDLEAQAQAAYDVAEAKDPSTNGDETPQVPEDAPEDAPAVDTPEDAPETPADSPEDAPETPETPPDEPETPEDAPEDAPDEPEKPIFDPESTLETFVYEGLQPITVIGKDGLEYSVKVPEELPDDFEFRSTKEEKLFDQAMFRQQSAAEQLVDSYNQQQQVAEQQSYNKSMRSEIDDAIAAGRIDKFDGRKLNMDGKGEKRAQQVLDYMTELNSNYVKAGKNYRVNSFEQALDLLEAKEARDKLAEYQKSIDNGKKSTASMTPSAGQSGGGEGSKPKTMPRNMSASDFVNMLDSQGEI